MRTMHGLSRRDATTRHATHTVPDDLAPGECSASPAAALAAVLARRQSPLSPPTDPPTFALEIAALSRAWREPVAAGAPPTLAELLGGDGRTTRKADRSVEAV